MRNVEAVRSLEKIKLLTDSRRMEILRHLMASPATLTQLARLMNQTPAWVRHHISVLQAADLVELSEIRKTGKLTEKFYRAKADAFFLQEIILPKSKRPPIVFSGSHDLALEGIAENLQKHLMLLSMPVGSLDGLVNLRQGLCHISGSHLLDESGEYNLPFIRHLFPDRDVHIITLAHRMQGLIVASGNPLGMKRIADLAKLNVRFVNRNPGSGTRLWLDAELRKSNIPAIRIKGYDRTVNTHSAAAAAVQSRKADAALGLQAAAHHYGLGFVPLFEERYDLVLPRDHQKSLTPLLDYLQTAAFRRELTALRGYNAAHSGDQISI